MTATATPAAETREPRLPLGPMLRMQVAVEQRIFWRNKSGMFFTFILPIALLFTLALSNDPIDMVPFIAALGILSTGFQGLSIQLAMHRDQGVLKRIMATPLPASLLILGKAISTTIVILVEILIVITVGVGLFDAPLPEHPFILLGLVLLGTATFVALGYALASIIPTSESAPAITNAAYLGLLLVTVLIAQVDAIPDWLQDIGTHGLPLRALIESIDHAWMGPWKASDAWSALTLAAWGAIGALWSVRRFRWEPANER
ncbi:MAG: type transporter [Thermoleophilia bacterium]|nr:type transporter [Thermoleophilia bacterium]